MNFGGNTNKNEHNLKEKSTKFTFFENIILSLSWTAHARPEASRGGQAAAGLSKPKNRKNLIKEKDFG